MTTFDIVLTSVISLSLKFKVQLKSKVFIFSNLKLEIFSMIN